MSDLAGCRSCGVVREAGYAFPLCASCRTILVNRPFPRSIHIASAVVLVALATALSQSPKTLRAGIAFERGQARESAGAYHLAVSEYRRVAEAFPDSTLVLARLAINLKRTGHEAEASVILQRLAGREAWRRRLG